MSGDLADSELEAFIAKLETAEEEFVQGQSAPFQALWSRADDVTLCGGFGGVERGWKKVTDRLSWVSKTYSDGTRTREEISRMVAGDFAYLVQKEVIHSRLGSGSNAPPWSSGRRWCFAASRTAGASCIAMRIRKWLQSLRSDDRRKDRLCKRSTPRTLLV